MAQRHTDHEIFSASCGLVINPRCLGTVESVCRVTGSFCCLHLCLRKHLSKICVCTCLGPHPCTPHPTWSLEWGECATLCSNKCLCSTCARQNSTLCDIPGAAADPSSQHDLRRVEFCSVCVPGDPRRTGIRQTTGYMSSTKGYRTGQRWEPFLLCLFVSCKRLTVQHLPPAVSRLP